MPKRGFSTHDNSISRSSSSLFPEEYDSDSNPETNELKSENFNNIQNKFKSLELKTRNFETTIMQLMLIQAKRQINISNLCQQTQFPTLVPDLIQGQSILQMSSRPSLACSEQKQFISSLVRFYLHYANGLCIRLCEENLLRSLDENPFESLIVKCACSLAFPIISRLKTGKPHSLRDNPFYFNLKNSISNCFESPSMLILSALSTCCYLEVGHGASVPASLTIVKGLRIMYLIGITEDERFSDLLLSNPLNLTKSFLWNFWSNCKELDDNEVFKKSSEFNLKQYSSKFFKSIQLSVDQKYAAHDLVTLRVFHIFNLQMYRYITILQRKISIDPDRLSEAYDEGLSFLTCLTKADVVVEAWECALLSKEFLEDKNFFSKATQAIIHYSNHLLALNLLLSCTSHHSKRSSSQIVPDFRDTCEKLLEIFNAIEYYIETSTKLGDASLFYSLCFTNTLPYYYMCLLCLEDHSSRGSLIFCQCLAKMKDLSGIWTVLNEWILLVVGKRKNHLPFIKPPLTINYKD